MAKRLKSWKEACEVADRKRELFEKHMGRAVAAWAAWKKAEADAERWGKRTAEREQSRLNHEQVAVELTNKQFGDEVIAATKEGAQ